MAKQRSTIGTGAAKGLRSEFEVPLILILSIAVQAGLIVHVIKTGRNSLWIWAIALLPPAGPIAYIAMEILPEVCWAAERRAAPSRACGA
jgi:hypothetical protein